MESMEQRSHIYIPNRKTLPCNIIQIWTLIRKGYRTTTTITKNLKKTPSDVAQILQDMEKDGFLEIEFGKHNIPNYEGLEQTLRLQKHDVYCFECYKPGDLENCKGCHRSFHINCKRSDPKKPLIPLHKPIPKTIQQVYDRLFSPAMGVPCLNTSHNESTVNESSLNETLLNESLLNETTTSNNVNIDEANVTSSCGDYFKYENDETENINDITFMGVIRYPYTCEVSPFKFEPIDNNDDYNNLCTVCKLLTTAEISNPVGIDQEKINQLLKKVYVKYSSWLPPDTFNENISLMIPNKDIDLFEKILFCKIMTLRTMKDKFETNQYGSIIEFFCDSLDIQYCIGVLRGVDTEDYEASKYFVLDVLHDITEIQTCLDCYINSTKKKPQSNWFILPCKPTHELVLAKISGFPDWPAKVIRQRNNVYEVRFFGGKNERSTISEKYIKPIDFSLHIKNNIKHNKAMAQLLEYRCLNEPRTYGETDDQVNNTLNLHKIIDNLPTTSIESLNNTTQKQKRKSTSNVGKQVDNSIQIQENIDSLPTTSIESLNNTTSIQNIDNSVQIQENIDNLPTSMESLNNTTQKQKRKSTSNVGKHVDNSIQIQENIDNLPTTSIESLNNTTSKQNIVNSVQIQENINNLPTSMESLNNTTQKQKRKSTLNVGKQVDNSIQIQENIDNLPTTSMECLNNTTRKQKTDSKVDDGKQIDNSIQIQENINDSSTTSMESLIHTKRQTRKRKLVSYVDNEGTIGDLSKVNVSKKPKKMKNNKQTKQLSNTLTSRNISHRLSVPNELGDKMTLENLKTLLETHNLSENVLADIFGIVTKLNENYVRQIKFAKEREWCKVCHKLATIHCCLSTSYCSIECKTIDWEYGHREESVTHQKENSAN